MKKFVVGKHDFYFNDSKFKILSGAIHYFRIHPSDWRQSLHNLKALGFNTVETYVPWNVHEEREGQFDFSEGADLNKFIELAQNEGLYVIVRPSPYICAEWEFGGLPAWLLEKNCDIRSDDPNFLKFVANYYQKLFEILAPLQITHDGPIIMMQVENEYGSYGEDANYLRSIRNLMLKNGVDVPLFTSDGAWHATLAAGNLMEEGILETGNFGSKANDNFSNILSFQNEKKITQPLMNMEFWDGWFDRWGEPIHVRDQDEMVAALKEVIEHGSVNMYMFHGGTNFGFMNGCSARKNHDLPQITSYDYGAPLNEQGNPTSGYFKIQKMIHERFPKIQQEKPWTKESMELSKIKLQDKVSLFEVLDEISERTVSKYPQTMEKVGQYYGYLLYRTKTERDAINEKYRIIDGRDRAQFFLNRKLQMTQYQEEIGNDIFVTQEQSENEIAILMENMGRVNYGHKLLADTQRKGIRSGVMSDLHYIINWEQYALDFSRVDRLDFSRKWEAGVPAFYRFLFDLDKILDTNIDLRHFGKGVVVVNGFNLGRFWQKGPIHSLYLPHGILRAKNNEVIVFETEGKFSDEISLVKEPIK
ncbi:glycoside hydrolase family 35 protein [Ligilactobacillus pobuzihii]|nr:glycosyl hydrolase [Ligilactobacillus pobuzihii]